VSSSPLSIIVSQDKPTVLVQSDPQVILVQYSAKRGTDGSNGADADFTSPGTVEAMIDALANQITSSQLHADLISRIDKIDLGPTSLESQQALLAYAQSQADVEIAGYADRLLANENALVDQSTLLTTLGSDLTTLDGTVAGNAAVVQQLNTRVIATEDDIISQASLIEGVGARIDVTEQNLVAQSAVVNQISADVASIDGDITAVASSVSTLSAQVGTNTSAIQTTQTAVASLEGDVYAEYTVKLDVNGNVSGFGLFGTATSSLFEIIADRFAIVNGVGSSNVPFIVDGSDVYIKHGLIQDAEIDTLQVANNAITVTDFADFSSHTCGSTQETVLSVSVYAPTAAIGQRVSCIFSTYAYSTNISPLGSVSFADIAGSEVIVLVGIPAVAGDLKVYVHGLSHIVSAAGTCTFTLSGKDVALSFGWAFATLNKR